MIIQVPLLAWMHRCMVSGNPSWIVCDELLKKHPKSQPAHSAALKSLEGCDDGFHPEAFDGSLICTVALLYLWCSWALWIGCLWLEAVVYFLPFRVLLMIFVVP